MDAAFTTYDPNTAGSKGLVYVGDKIVVYRRDNATAVHPLEIDLPGGAPEGQETPFETFAREVEEEFNLQITPDNIIASHTYPSRLDPGQTAYFFVARLPKEAAGDIAFSDEGMEYMLVTPDEYLTYTNAWEYIRDQARRYIGTPAKA